MTTDTIYYKSEPFDYRFSCANDILKHFLKKPTAAKDSIESTIEGISVKIFFRKGQWNYILGQETYSYPKLIVVSGAPKIREVFTAEVVERSNKTFSWSSKNLERKKEVYFQLEFLSSEKDVLPGYRDRGEKKSAKRKKT